MKRTAVLLKLMGNPERLAIMVLLKESERSIGELAGLLALQPTVVSKHLTRLRAEGVVDYTRYYRVLQYRLVSQQAAAVLDTLLSLGAKPKNPAGHSVQE
ncbi:winged helix-turn-helix transcriptional regulator [Neisseria sp. 19428wB4_WF04]|nr:winged helix-turn-helix transcriptional regulator [Neisseria sp. 19428wB4_WF04]TFU40550.1 ArsR family transcriptional regulator [Neisseria sp. WF04]